MKHWKSRTLLVLSAPAAAVGVFLPLASLPVYGEITYRDAFPIGSYLVFGFALLAPVLLFTGKKRFTLFAALGVWCTLLWPTIQEKVFAEEPGIFESMFDAVASPVESYAADFFLNITEFEWGGLVFLAGCVIHALSCFVVTVGKR